MYLTVAFANGTIGANETSEIYIEVGEDFVGESGSITFSLVNDLGPAEFQISVQVFTSTPDAPILITPINGDAGLDFAIPFEWSSTGTVYELEIATTPDFNGPIRRITDISTNQLSLRDFDATTTYYWRVRGINECGTGNYSNVASFTTGTIICQTTSAADLPISIGLDPITITSSLEVDLPGEISAIKVIDVRGVHTWISDLTITHPSCHD